MAYFNRISNGDRWFTIPAEREIDSSEVTFDNSGVPLYYGMPVSFILHRKPKRPQIRPREYGFRTEFHIVDRKPITIKPEYHHIVIYFYKGFNGIECIDESSIVNLTIQINLITNDTVPPTSSMRQFLLKHAENFYHDSKNEEFIAQIEEKRSKLRRQRATEFLEQNAEIFAYIWKNCETDLNFKAWVVEKFQLQVPWMNVNCHISLIRIRVQTQLASPIYRLYPWIISTLKKLDYILDEMETL